MPLPERPNLRNPKTPLNMAEIQRHDQNEDLVDSLLNDAPSALPRSEGSENELGRIPEVPVFTSPLAQEIDPVQEESTPLQDMHSEAPLTQVGLQEPTPAPNPAENAPESSTAVFQASSFNGGSLDHEDDLREKEVQAKLQELSNGRERKAQNPLYSDLTSEDLITNDWSRYSYLQDKVVELREWVNNILIEQNRTAEIAQARSERGAKYDEMYALIKTLLTKHFMQEKVINSQDSAIVTSFVANEILGLGIIEPLWRDERISEIMVNGPYKVRVEMGGRLIDVPGAQFRSSEHLMDVSQQILAPINRQLDYSHPLQDGSLVDGSRVNIVHTSIANLGPYLTIRRFPDTVFSLQELVENFKSMSPEMATELGNYIHAGLSTIIVGGTGTGKTSMLNALSGCIPASERIIVVEDTSELRLHPDRDVTYLQARPAQGDKDGAVTIRDCVMNTLRMRPDRIVVGEVRDFAAYDMLQAMNTGHDGSLTTVHANDAHGGVERLVNLLSEGGDEAVNSNRVLALISSGVDLFVTIMRFEDGSRRCSGIYEIPNRVTVIEGTAILDPIPLWEFEQTGLDENDKVIGHWVKKNEISESMRRKHRLDYKKKFTLEEIYAASEQSPASE